ncbi:extracellular elastinolytic metallo proteinase [Auriscalpium vulgare]|uniref:Extracellular elastinolytic metallo proteinase n=1 Tax=Auriscalpium vulgare TaxID=40419 RepID=A0ACB8S548_9AGAM|nr:extracellular elastinolytic metallo proteinase [Auriscalpium vulgare]
MRLLSTTLAFAGLATFAAAHSGSASRRKTLGFGPVHPTAQLQQMNQWPIGLRIQNVQDPYEVARAFVVYLYMEQLGYENTFAIRSDSYTDKTTGVSHMYVRQLINGVEVVDGDININIKDGRVLSFGDSFYRGEAPTDFNASMDDTPGPHAEYCQILENELQTRLLASEQANGQVQLGSSFAVPPEHEAIAHLYHSNCESLGAQLVGPDAGAGTFFDPRHALLQFMVAATPKKEVAQDIADRYDEHIANMNSWFEHGLVGAVDVQMEVIDNVPDTVNPVKAKPVYIQLPDGDKTKLVHAWRYEVEMEDNWYEAVVSVQYPHRILSVVDWASDSPLAPSHSAPVATYNVFKWGINDPSEGNRSIAKENFDSLASPLGWHVIPVANDPLSANVRKTSTYSNYTTTFGNNVFAHENWEGQSSWLHNYRPDGGKGLEFDYTYDPKPTNRTDSLDEAKKYINATVTQLFYTTNLIHDLYYRYGFDEVSGNFQQHNFGRGGKENDAVIANAQDGSGFNNANFMTPPDGQNGRCRMYLWNTASPYRDGDLEAGIVIHELSHGLSTRLTGGPANSGCLGWGESGGMGEGWGDFLATTIRSNSTYSDFPMGAWAANQVGGIRNFPYSLNETINPSTYKTLDKGGYWGVHAIGEVWAQILWVVGQRLIAKHGFVEDLFPPAPLADGSVPPGDFYRPVEFDAFGAPKPLVPKHGNSLIVQLVLNGMKLQSCRPSFFDARDAIIQADEILTGGENYCDLWLAFAEKGLGQDAKVEGRTPWGGGIRTNGFTVPKTCTPDAPEPVPSPEPTPGEPDDDDDDDEPDWPWARQ